MTDREKIKQDIDSRMAKRFRNPKEGDLRVYHIPQLPGKPFLIAVANIEEAKKILTVLSEYDLFQFGNRIKPDFANANGLEVFEGIVAAGGEWTEWQNEDGDSIDDVLNNE